MGKAQAEEGYMMKTIGIFVDTRYRVGHSGHIKALADPEVAERWIEANDPEGLAFEYEIIQ